MKTRTLICVLVIFAFGISAQFSIADDFDWPRWRGPNGDGISVETDWNPETLSDGLKVVWKTNVGIGYSNMAIKGKYLYTMGNNYKDDIVYCLNVENGEEDWQYSYRSAGSGYGSHTTPTIDGKYVYTLSTEGHLYCFISKNGKVKWEKNIVTEYGAVRPNWGFSGSPVIVGDLVIITVNKSGMALDKKTGKKVWISEPGEKLEVNIPQTGSEYATPVIYEYKGMRSAAIFSSRGLYSVDVETGEQQWFYNWKPYMKVSVADPIIFDNKVFISCAYRAACVLLDISQNEPKAIWKNHNMRNHYSTIVLIDGYMYGIDGYYSEAKLLTCIDFKTGEKMWSENLNPVSLMAADDKLIILNEQGTLLIAEATPSTYKEISSGTIPDQKGFEKWWAPPVLLRGRIYCRSSTGDLVCIDVSK